MCRICKDYDEILLKKISNGVPVNNIYGEEIVMFTYHNNPVSIYKDNDGIMKSYRVFNIN